jgi:hypothetical protein
LVKFTGYERGILGPFRTLDSSVAPLILQSGFQIVPILVKILEQIFLRNFVLIPEKKTLLLHFKHIVTKTLTDSDMT